MEHPLESEGVCEDLRSQLLCGMCKTLLRVPVGCGACPHAWCSQCLAGFVAAREDGINGKKQTRGAEFECPAEGCTARARAKDYKVLRHLQALTNALAGHGKRGRGGSGRDPSSATGFGNSGDHDGEHGGGSYSRSERLSSSSSGGGGGSSTCRLNFTFKGMTASKARSCYSKPQLRGVKQCEGTAKEKLERDKARLRRFQTQFNAEFRSGATGMTHEQFVKVFNRQELARERAEEGGGKIQVSSNGRGYRALETKMRKAMKAMAKKGKKEAMKKVYKKNGSLRPSGFKTRVLYGLRATVPAKFRVVYSEKAQRPFYFNAETGVGTFAMPAEIRALLTQGLQGNEQARQKLCEDISELRRRACDDDSEPLVYTLRRPEDSVDVMVPGEQQLAGAKRKRERADSRESVQSRAKTYYERDVEMEEDDDDKEIVVIETEELRKGKERTLQDDKWVCSVCTLRNSTTKRTCAACNTRRE